MRRFDTTQPHTPGQAKPGTSGHAKGEPTPFGTDSPSIGENAGYSLTFTR